jgi:hypothetical protein
MPPERMCDMWKEFVRAFLRVLAAVEAAVDAIKDRIGKVREWLHGASRVYA